VRGDEEEGRFEAGCVRWRRGEVKGQEGVVDRGWVVIGGDVGGDGGERLAGVLICEVYLIAVSGNC